MVRLLPLRVGRRPGFARCSSPERAGHRHPVRLRHVRASFFARPLGGIVFGHFGDKIGRKKMLVSPLLLMGAATFAIGLLPTFASIGIAAPLLLICCRLLQGFAVGGESGGAVLMAAEDATAAAAGSGRRGPRPASRWATCSPPACCGRWPCFKATKLRHLGLADTVFAQRCWS